MGVGDQAKKTLAAAVDRGIGVQQPTVEKYIARAKQRNPSATPSEVIASLERQYLSAMIALGGASGASAAAPAVGTGVGLIVNIAEVGAFVEASAPKRSASRTTAQACTNFHPPANGRRPAQLASIRR